MKSINESPTSLLVGDSFSSIGDLEKFGVEIDAPANLYFIQSL